MFRVIVKCCPITATQFSSSSFFKTLETSVQNYQKIYSNQIQHSPFKHLLKNNHTHSKNQQTRNCKKTLFTKYYNSYSSSHKKRNWRSIVETARLMILIYSCLNLDPSRAKAFQETTCCWCWALIEACLRFRINLLNRLPTLFYFSMKTWKLFRLIREKIYCDFCKLNRFFYKCFKQCVN